MRRIHTRPKGAPVNDPRVGQPMWSKPGTPMDAALRAMTKAIIAGVKRERAAPDMSIRQQRRAYQRYAF